MKRIVVGISGASGTHLACRFVSQLKRYTECEVHVVVTDSGRLTASYEEPQLLEQMQETSKDGCTQSAVSGKQPVPVYQEFDKAA